ncbi:MAG TPA: hypothetical protein VJN65_07455 [Bacteroidota bacterium]|nr:hypothetical protein [Bacteroidota bacterium]
MNPNKSSDNLESLAESVRKLEERIEHLESYLGIERTAMSESTQDETIRLVEIRDEEELEFEVGQKWFAKAGIVVLAIGMAFVLTFPYEGLPPVLPSLFGFGVAGAMILLARYWRSVYLLISQYLFGAGLALLYFATLRLFFFSDQPPLEPNSAPGIILLLLDVGVILVVSLRRKSIYLTGLALFYGFLAALVIGDDWAVLTAIVVLGVCTTMIRLRTGWNAILLLGTGLAYFTHLLWSLGNPIMGHEIQIVASPGINIWFVLLYAGLFATALLKREKPQVEDIGIIMSSGLNMAGGYGLFLFLTLTSFQDNFVASHIVTSVVFLTIAILFWTWEKSRFSTFLYSMFGYMALSVALLKAFSPPPVFVWLSLQSILVLSTAIWFRSRFIVVANFVIFLAIVIGYLVVTEGESGMSIGFGVVALLSARILNWQQDRLELKTEMMRNAYLAAAFCAFPYALFYLMPEGTASLSWVGIALFYYLMGALVKKQKYRWMGHLTLGLTVLYVMIIGIIQLEETLRILSFLVLGCVLIVVSIFFTRLRSRKRAEKKTE